MYCILMHSPSESLFFHAFEKNDLYHIRERLYVGSSIHLIGNSNKES